MKHVYSRLGSLIGAIPASPHNRDARVQSVKTHWRFRTRSGGRADRGERQPLAAPQTPRAIGGSYAG